MKRKNLEKGITLIALVITIILLLILAGVTISIVFKEGIIDKSQNSVDTYDWQSAREKLQLELVNMKMEKSTNTLYNSENYLTSKLEESGFNVNGDIVTVDGYKFTIDRDELIIVDDIDGLNVAMNYEIQSYNGINEDEKDTANFLLNVSSDYNIEKIIIKDNNNISQTISTTGKTFAQLVELEINKEYKVFIQMEKNKNITKKLNTKIENIYDINFLESNGGFETTIGECERSNTEGLTGKNFEVISGDEYKICQLEKNVSLDLSKKFELSFTKKIETTSNSQIGGIRIILQEQSTNGSWKENIKFVSSDFWANNQNVINRIYYDNSSIFNIYNTEEKWAIIGDGESLKVYCNNECVKTVNQINGMKVDKIVIQFTKYQNYNVPTKNYIERLYLGPIKNYYKE